MICLWYIRGVVGGTHYISNHIHLPIHLSHRCLINDLSLQDTVMKMETTTRYISCEEIILILKLFWKFSYTSTQVYTFLTKRLSFIFICTA